MEHYLIAIDFKDSYVDFSAYEKYRRNRHKGFFRRMVKPMKNPMEHHSINYPESLFVIEEEN